MKLLAIGRPREGADVHEIGRHAREEMAALWRLYRDGAVREMYSPGRPGRRRRFPGTARGRRGTRGAPPGRYPTSLGYRTR